MERLGIFLYVSLFCIVVFIFFFGIVSENIVNEIL